MKQALIVANWKSNKVEKEVNDWFETFSAANIPDNVKVVVCPSFQLLSLSKSLALEKCSRVEIGAQDISQFDSGAHTGEVNTDQLQELASWIIVGHSERRSMGETEEILQKKVEMAKKNNLKVIYCVSEVSQNIPSQVDAVAYEPLFAIGSGTADTPENAQKTAKEIKEKNNLEIVLYGGSVKSGNVSSFLACDSIDGVLVGGASLDPVEFLRIVSNSS